MSRHIATLVYQKRVGSMAKKSILAYCAERANDDGTAVWASKTRIAKEVECSRQTVVDTMKSFVEEGLLFEVGRRKTKNGYVIEYRMNVAAIRALDDALDDPFSVEDPTCPDLDMSNELTSKRQATGQQSVKPLDMNRPRTVQKPSNTPKPPEGASDLFSANGQTVEHKTEPDRFDEFWFAYPKKAGKPAAKKAWDKALKRADAQTIIDGARRYAHWLSSAGPKDFRPLPKHPQGWLNDDRWADEEIRHVRLPGEVSDEERRRRFAPQWGEVVR